MCAQCVYVCVSIYIYIYIYIYMYIYIVYIYVSLRNELSYLHCTSETRESGAKGFSFVRRCLSGKCEGNNSTSRGVRSWRILDKIITGCVRMLCVDMRDACVCTVCLTVIIVLDNRRFNYCTRFWTDNLRTSHLKS